MVSATLRMLLLEGKLILADLHDAIRATQEPEGAVADELGAVAHSRLLHVALRRRKAHARVRRAYHQLAFGSGLGRELELDARERAPDRALAGE